MSQIKYKRILLKLSGEALAGEQHRGLDYSVIHPVCEAIKQCHELGVQIGLVIGGGNFWRGVKDGADKMQRSHGDAMGMLATVMNSIAMADALEQHGVPARVLSAVEECGVNFEHMPSGIDTLSVVMATEEFAPHKEKIMQAICNSVDPDIISVEDGMAMIAVVGRGMVRRKGLAAKLFTAIAQADVNLRMIDQGSSELNIIIGVDEADLEKAIAAVYYAFCE